jgi:cbb3-type cytochrome oxidase subunit 3
MSKRTLASMFVLCLAKMTTGVLHVSVAQEYMGYGYTWSLYWQTLEAFILIVLKSFFVVRCVFVLRPKAEAEYDESSQG